MSVLTLRRQTPTTYRLALLALFITMASAVTAQENNAKLYAEVVRAEMKDGGLGERDYVCLALRQYSDPSKSLLTALKSEGLALQKPAKCMFRGYQIHLEQTAPDSIHAKLVDVRYVDTDLAILLRDGVYSVEKDATGKWKIRDYKAVPASDRK